MQIWTLDVRILRYERYITRKVAMKQLITSPKALGSIIRRARKQKKLNQQQAGHLFNIIQSTVSSIESGAPGTRLETILRMLAALELEMVIRSKKQTDEVEV